MDGALAVLKFILQSDRENPEANRLTGRTLHERGSHKEALEYLNHAFRLKQDAATAGVLGQCHYALGDYTKAKVYLEKALSQDIRDPNNSCVLGRICLARGMGALAEKYLLTAQEAGMDEAELYVLLGRSYLLQRKYTGPILVRGFPQEAKPGDVVDGYVVLGKAEGATNQYKVCTRYGVLYEGMRLLKVRPDSSDAHFILAMGWLAAGNRNLADKHLKPLLAREAKSPRALELQVRLLLAGQDYAMMEEVLDAAGDAKLFKAATVAEFYYRAAMALRAKGNGKEAVRLLSKAERHMPTSARILRSSASLHLNAGRREQARQYYTRLVELFPDADDIDELRNTLRVLKEETGVRE